MSVLIISALLALLLILGLPTLQQIAVALRELSAFSAGSVGDIVKTIDLPGSSSTR